jgi:hypothetical protein
MKIKLSNSFPIIGVLFYTLLSSCSNSTSSLKEETTTFERKTTNEIKNVDLLFFQEANNKLQLSKVENLQIIKGFKSLKLGLNRDSLIFDQLRWKIDTISEEKGIYIYYKYWNDYNQDLKYPDINGINIYHSTLTFVKDTLTTISLNFRDVHGIDQSVIDQNITSTVTDDYIAGIEDKSLENILISAFGKPMNSNNDISLLKKTFSKEKLKTFGTRIYKNDHKLLKIDSKFPNPSYEYKNWFYKSIYLSYSFYYYTINEINNYSDNISLHHCCDQKYEIGYKGIDEIIKLEKIKKTERVGIKNKKNIIELKKAQINKL